MSQATIPSPAAQEQGYLAKAKQVVPRFTSEEKRNLVFYITGIMLYKFGLESFNGTIKALALERLAKSEKFTMTGYLDGFNQALQCVGSIVVAPLLVRFPIRAILAFAIACFAVISCIPMIIEGATGGKAPQWTDDGKAVVGAWNPRIVVPIFAISGLTHGMVEIIRRIIPRDMVGGNVMKLKRMDSMVHIFYEVAGTGGAFFATFMALNLGKAFAPITTPFCFVGAALLWSRIKVTSEEAQQLSDVPDGAHGGVISGILGAFASFGTSVAFGAKIIFTDRRFTWLIFGYSIPLVLHRYIENGVAANYAQLVLGEASYGPLIVGGSNFGELCGAFFVFLFTSTIKTPLPWLRLDALTLSIAWVYSAITPTGLGITPLATAWVLAAIMVTISFGWAAGDVSLSAFIQSHVSKSAHNRKTSTLGAVMSFLYVTYIVIYAVISPVIGNWLDSMKADKIHQQEEYLKWIPGVMFTCTGVIIFASTFWPKGSFAFNPTLEDEYPENEAEAVQHEEVDDKKKQPVNVMEELM
ncbi:uncharacterized protein EV422DRAFT_566350 [Fimicolochytrium jonesii]|uniref:uncharacterized protein n=1 Tax=Fimicolochytrium jonesii TaxID=1396493 RepID=UPI0022FF35AA|nr:uncharacterized protein EV422DRAFT_566350 [Fimicolochytrium jonesii]KAI8822682.1 hypothetical protein EV422DRAFT_566350 [Fimicolochytrium jonesii]